VSLTDSDQLTNIVSTFGRLTPEDQGRMTTLIGLLARAPAAARVHAEQMIWAAVECWPHSRTACIAEVEVTIEFLEDQIGGAVRSSRHLQ
jgi:hypothetical protein